MSEDEKEGVLNNKKSTAEAAVDGAPPADILGADATGADVPAETEDSSEPASEATLEEQLALAEARAEEYLDGWQRARAEFANARKRMQRESAETYRNATVDVISRLLPIIDDFERAFANIPQTIAEDNWIEGIQLVSKKLQGILENAAIEPIPAVGEEFDPNVHNAIMKEPSEEYESGTVIRELQKGYKLGERVIRPTVVVVAD